MRMILLLVCGEILSKILICLLFVITDSKMTIEKDEVSELQNKVENIMCPGGFEVHPFLVGWYNEVVAPKFHLDFPDSTLAFILISQPRMFEQSFLPFLSSQYTSGCLQDPIDQCMLHCFSKLKNISSSVVTLHDFQLSPARRPKILVQSAGHVAGAVRFYKPEVGKY